MALVPLATKGNYFHIYDFRVKPGQGDEFVELFNKFDYGDSNPFHRSRAQVKGGVLCRGARRFRPFLSDRRMGGYRGASAHSRVSRARSSRNLCN